MNSKRAGQLRGYLKSSVGRKQVVAVSGLFMLFGFLLPHLGGNLFFYLGRDAYNSYAEHLHQLEPMLRLMEVVLSAAVLVHVVFTGSLVYENITRRGQRYANDISTKKRTFTARTMPITGAMILVFIVLHLMTVKFSPAPMLENGEKDVYMHLLQLFSNPIWVGCYLVFLVAVGMHVSHAFSSGFKTLGIVPTRHRKMIQRTGVVTGFAFFVLFGMIPVVSLVKSKCLNVTTNQAAQAPIETAAEPIKE